MLSIPPADSREGSSSNSACAPFPEHAFVSQAANVQVGAVLSVDALCASAFHPSWSERGWDRQDAGTAPSLCTACEGPHGDFVGVFLRASASSWGNQYSQAVVVSISLMEYESEQNVSSALRGGLTDTQAASEIAGVFFHLIAFLIIVKLLLFA